MFQFFTVVEHGKERSVRRVPMEGTLQTALSEEMAKERDAFIDGVEIIPYEPGYRPEHEVFVIKDYVLPKYLEKVLEKPDALPALDRDELEGNRVKSFFGVRIGKRAPRDFLFQSFNAGQVVRRGRRFLFLDAETFKSSDRSGLRIDDKITAAIEGGSLYFRSEYLVRRYLDLDLYFREATDEEIEKLVAHPAFAPFAPARLIEESDRWIRRKMTAIRERGILDAVAVSEIVRIGGEFDVRVSTKVIEGDQRITFPDEKKGVKALLRLLDEDLLESPLTDARFQVNSKRRL